ncbi:MAG TPA: peptide chain release factor N(5)-glutamine methyltransferase [Gemmatimonadales bacterium]
MSDAAVRTIGEVVREGTARLEQAAIELPRREAERIWGALRRAAPADAVIHRDDPADAGDEIAFAEAVRRRAGGEPLAYVIGRWGFRHLELRVDRRALIPRPETELLVELLLARVEHGTVADLGTGSGCIALSLLDEGRFDRVVALDRSPAALALARENAAITGFTPQFLLGDLTAPLATASCDALVSNPPYLTDAEHAALAPDVRAWEPAQALASGADGMTATRALVADGLRVVRPGGWLAVELDASRAAVAAGLAAAAGWRDISVINDLFGRERYLLARRSDA